jgi:hypothetical protein
MDEALLAAWRATAYVVCLDAVQWPAIHIDAPLPAALQAVVGDQAWGFITAWNPHSRPRGEDANLAAQRELLAALKGHAELRTLHPAIGIGADGWHEPSLFVVGPSLLTLDAWAAQFGQSAYVYGVGNAAACLRLLDP